MINKIPGFIDYQLTGSFYTCDPPVLTTDEDYIILVREYKKAETFLHKNGWKPCHGKEYVGASFLAYRKDHLNYILTADDLFFDKFCAATELAKKRNLLKKEDRIQLFERIIHEEMYA